MWQYTVGPWGMVEWQPCQRRGRQIAVTGQVDMTWRDIVGKRLAVRTVAVTVKAGRYGFSGRFRYGAEAVRLGSEMGERPTRGGGVTRRNVTFSEVKVPPSDALRY